MLNFGYQAALHLFVHLVALIVTWWAIQSFKLDLFLRNPKGAKAKVLLIFLTIAISYLVAKFFLDYLNWSMNLPQIYG
ncbi:putative integral membrane protein (TIGR02327 family) [Scopulibacillus darangshiensis]|uniref:Putative integral membrane protein (TIGR02327 family) n=1 Tax=Scopulibacillus darangshiensis TaxID=442528 RepID=A0A4R2NGC6_9BACL|nr:DUF1146 family protein [Scopulibacillus darangshiensis]TCP20262.1 putative integral membrane protein (TIGR02327 family) [Scopulibacillus darangshiensis]